MHANQTTTTKWRCLCVWKWRMQTNICFCRNMCWYQWIKTLTTTRTTTTTTARYDDVWTLNTSAFVAHFFFVFFFPLWDFLFTHNRQTFQTKTRIEIFYCIHQNRYYSWRTAFKQTSIIFVPLALHESVFISLFFEHKLTDFFWLSLLLSGDCNRTAHTNR